MKKRTLNIEAIIFSVLFGTCLFIGETKVTLSSELILDDRSSATLEASHGGLWRLMTDQVMGGISQGQVILDTVGGRDCIRLQGSVSTANNGGFIQMALDMNHGEHFDASAYNAIQLDVYGNSQQYNAHLKTSDLWLPWQSYRQSFTVNPAWQKITLAFDEFESYRTMRRFRPERLERIGLVAIGREFDAELCLAGLSLVKVEAPYR